MLSYYKYTVYIMRIYKKKKTIKVLLILTVKTFIRLILQYSIILICMQDYYEN